MPDDDGSSDDDKKQRQATQLLEAYSIAWMFPASIGAGFVIGWGLDKVFHTRPWLMWIFTGVGVLAAFVNLFRIGMRSDGS
jgi:F0F1-type ATP synthase assembly protein I